ncbi:MAG: NF038122 family metalloprotease [Elainellaceae cyanobacterium]
MRSLWFGKQVSHRYAQAIALMVGAVGAICSADAASALEFNFGFAEGTSPDVITGFEQAGHLWSSILSDDIEVNLNVEFRDINSPSLGFFEPQRVSYDYSEVQSALFSDQTSADDATAYNTLALHSDFDLLVDFDLLLNGTSNNPNGAGSLNPYIDNDGDCNNSSIRMTTANAKALGLSTSNIPNCGLTSPSRDSNSPDGTILLNSNFSWDFDVSDGIDAQNYDFVGVAAQGVGVIMGFISGVDVLDFNVPQVTNSQNTYFEDSLFPFVSPMDLFRYSEESSDLGIIDWTTGRTNSQGQEIDKYFSIDGGVTQIASFSTGLRNGDGFRASSWKPDELGGVSLGIMESTPAAGQTLQFSNNDSRLFDAIGWDLKHPSANAPTRGVKQDPPDNPDNPDNPDGPGDPGDTPDPVAVPEPSTAVPLILIVGLTLRLLRKAPR